MKDKEIDFSKSEKGENEFSYTLPNSKRNITFKILSWSDDESIDKELEALEKVGSEVKSEMTTRLKRRITSVDGKTEQSYINNFVDNEFFAVDSLAFREHIVDNTPDIDLEISVDIDGEEVEVAVPMTGQFFWPSSRV